jgi:hypothetical protein
MTLFSGPMLLWHAFPLRPPVDILLYSIQNSCEEGLVVMHPERKISDSKFNQEGRWGVCG